MAIKHKMHESLGTIACGLDPNEASARISWSVVDCPKCLAKKGKIPYKVHDNTLFKRKKHKPVSITWTEANKTSRLLTKTLGSRRKFVDAYE